LSEPSKMPGYGYSLPASRCRVGSKLRKMKNSVCSSCYACKNRYLFSNVQDAMRRRELATMRVEWEHAMIFLINRKAQQGHLWFRWHDSGDLQGMWHLQKIMHVAEATPDVHHWLPTKEYTMVQSRYDEHIPENLTIRLSAYYIDAMPEVPKSLEHMRTSTVHTKPKVFPDAQCCPAYTQDGECGNCRECWNADTKQVSYPKH
jgi:hypothetical protein